MTFAEFTTVELFGDTPKRIAVNPHAVQALREWPEREEYSQCSVEIIGYDNLLVLVKGTLATVETALRLAAAQGEGQA